MHIRPHVSVGLVLALGACAPAMETTGADGARTAGPRQCFQASVIRNFRADGPGVVYVRANDNIVYEVSTGGCPGLDFTNSMAMTADTPVGDRLCVGDYARISVPGSAGVCRARISRALTAEEVAAMPRQNRP
ncbi:DUF6491 family protein [Brevundimonas sp.]|uniref:DUF6491 family protein n=1 Tax=Brevundimonas sp. TaxID=1871086 RepID=UPI0027318F10|nr:DUF6491 family protein [Brevundimonas sp.]MDP1913233.1 DUF6491 family protein [Brevundimonas sp.]